MLREYHKWFSPNLNRDMELLVFGHGGRRVVAFPTREGRFFDYENFRLIATLQDQIDAGALQIYCVDSVDGEALYCRHCCPWDRTRRQVDYEAYILNEVVPLAHRMNPHNPLVAHGCSFGAYHAVNIALRHPDVFSEVIAFSGRFDLTKSVGGFDDLLSGHYNDDVYYLMPNHFMPNLADEQILAQMRRMRIILAVGADDAFIESNRELCGALAAKRIPHEMYVWEGEAHRFRAWRSMARQYLV
jgi:esterase/lipase superfamily enzyme